MSSVLPPSSLGAGFSSLHLEQPDRSSEQRYRLDLSNFERIGPWMRVYNHLGLSRDTRPRSGALGVQQHIYEFSSRLQLSTAKLFRYGFSLGPQVLLEQTVTRTNFNQVREESYYRWQLGWHAAAQLDYAFNEFWEISLHFALQQRPITHKSDKSFGISLLLNSRPLAKEGPLAPPKSPSPSL